MTVRGKLLAVALAVGLLAGTAFGQPPEKGEVTPEDIQALQQQLSALAAIRGMKPEEQERFLKQLEQMRKAGDGNFKLDDFLKQKNRPNPQPVPPPPPPPPIQPPRQPREQFGPRPVPPPPQNPGNFPDPDFGKNGEFNPNFKPPDPRLNGNPDAQEMMKFWEQNFGPLEKTPAVRDAILDLFNLGQDGGEFGNGDWKNFLDDFNKNGGDGNNEGFADWMKEMNFEGGKWDWPDMGGGWEFPKFGGGGGWGNNAGGGGGGGGGWWGGGGGGGGSFGGGGGSWLPVILLVVIAVGALLAWKFWPMLANRQSQAAEGVRDINRWPVDPRTIKSREELVKAFEYLSVLLCGDAARVWNHETIARALRLQIPSSELVADELAKLYELARYTPPGEPLSPGSLADARRCLCHLAGVSA